MHDHPHMHSNLVHELPRAQGSNLATVNPDSSQHDGPHAGGCRGNTRHIHPPIHLTLTPTAHHHPATPASGKELSELAFGCTVRHVDTTKKILVLRYSCIHNDVRTLSSKISCVARADWLPYHMEQTCSHSAELVDGLSNPVNHPGTCMLSCHFCWPRHASKNLLVKSLKPETDSCWVTHRTCFVCTMPAVRGRAAQLRLSAVRSCMNCAAVGPGLVPGCSQCSSPPA